MSLKWNRKKIATCVLVAFVVSVLVACGGKSADLKDMDKLPFEEKIALLDANIKKDPKNPELYYKKAKLYYENDNTTEALFDIEKAISLDGKNAVYYLLQADIFFAKGESTLAFKSLDKAVEYDPKNIEAYLKTAELGIYLRDYNKARENIDKALKIDKINAKCYFMRGWIYKEVGDTLNAIKDYNKAKELKSDYEDAFEELANLYSIKDNPLAIDCYKSVISINPDNVNAMYNLGLLYQNHGAIQQALDMYEKVLKKKPGYANAIYAVGYINLTQKHDYDIALDCFNKTIKADSTYFEAYSGRAVIYRHKGQNAQALANDKMADSLRAIYGQNQ